MTAYELRISAWSSDFFSSYLLSTIAVLIALSVVNIFEPGAGVDPVLARQLLVDAREGAGAIVSQSAESPSGVDAFLNIIPNNVFAAASANDILAIMFFARSEEHTSELQSLMRISYAVFCLKKKTITTTLSHTRNQLTK